MNIPQISVIIPVYNTSNYLEECLNSIVNQSFSDLEIICVNDGSKDNSLEILEKFAINDNRIKIVNFDSPSGSAGRPRNVGLKKATGKYVMFLDSDDYFDLTMLEKLHNQAVKVKADLVMCDNYKVFSENNEISTLNSELDYEFIPNLEVFSYRDIPNKIFQISNAAIWHKLILRDLIIKNDLEFQLECPILDDIFFVNVLLVLAERISIINDRLVYYRMERDGAQTTKIEKHKESIIKSFDKLTKYLIVKNIYDDVKGSLQNWTISSMQWWVGAIENNRIFTEVLKLYRDSYFQKLGIDVTVLDNKYKSFYNNVCNVEEKIHFFDFIESSSNKGKTIALYGAGAVGQTLYKFINDGGEQKITIWCDKNSNEINNTLIVQPEKLIDNEYDIILIAIHNEKVVSEVKKYLNDLSVKYKEIYTCSQFLVRGVDI